MPAEPLFPDVTRTDASHGRAHESAYGWLQRVDDPMLDRVRTVLNAWFERFAVCQSAGEVNHLRGRFRAKEDSKFPAAFWELYLHELFSRLGFALEAHPETGKGTRPDYLVSRGDDRFYLEAVAPNPGMGDPRRPGSLTTVREYVTQAFHPDYRLRLRYIFDGKDTPSKVQVRDAVVGWLNQHLWEDCWAGRMAASAQPGADLEVGDGWVIGVDAIPLEPEMRGKEGGMVWFGESRSSYPEALGPAIVPQLEDKAMRYGDLGAPPVIAIWVRDTFAGPETAPLALFGHRVTAEPGTHPTGLDWIQERTAWLWSPGASSRGRVSAVLCPEWGRFNDLEVSRQPPGCGLTRGRISRC